MNRFVLTLAISSWAFSFAAITQGASANDGPLSSRFAHTRQPTHHHGRGYWSRGRWVPLAVGASPLGGIAAGYDRACYLRGGLFSCN